MNGATELSPFCWSKVKEQWLYLLKCDHRWYDLLVIMDDANREIFCAQLVEQRATPTVLASLREVIEEQGVFASSIAIEPAISFVLQRSVSRWTMPG